MLATEQTNKRKIIFIIYSGPSSLIFLQAQVHTRYPPAGLASSCNNNTIIHDYVYHVGDTPPVSKEACVALIYSWIGFCVARRWSDVAQLAASRYWKPRELDFTGPH